MSSSPLKPATTTAAAAAAVPTLTPTPTPTPAPTPAPTTPARRTHHGSGAAAAAAAIGLPPGAARHVTAGISDSVDLGAIIDAHPCAKLVAALEDCMGEHDRVWSKCQEQVRALRKCNAAAPPASSH